MLETYTPTYPLLKLELNEDRTAAKAFRPEPRSNFSGSGSFAYPR